MTRDQRDALITKAVTECERKRLFCEPPPTVEYFYSAPASCTVNCPDGTPFTYTVPAGVFLAKTFAEAQAAARAYACSQAPRFMICLPQWNACLCANVAINQSIQIGSANPPFSIGVTGGSFPPGLNIGVSGNRVLITGTTASTGVFTFILRVNDALGNSNSRTYSISVLAVTTTALDPYSSGVPYSFQLQAAGGSGIYAWRIVSGTLPSGLEMTIGGLIHGTPTQTATANLIFEVVDLTCESVNAQFIVPRVALKTRGTTRLRIKRGYPSYLPIVPTTSSVLYKKITWSGEIAQYATSSGEAVGAAKYVYTGATDIDIYGRFTSHHHKNLYAQCVRPIYPQIGPQFPGSFTQEPVTRLLGYCWPDDVFSCSTCTTNEEQWGFDSDKQTPNREDLPAQMAIDPNGIVRTSTTFDYEGIKSLDVNGIFGVNHFPGLVFRGSIPVTIPVINLTSDGDFRSVLSDSYTDADAIASQKTYANTTNTAENLPNYLLAQGNQWLYFLYSRLTTVNYDFNCTGLVVGNTYLLRFQLVDFVGAASTTTQSSVEFVATGSTQVVSGTLPTPSVGHRLQIKNATIVHG